MPGNTKWSPGKRTLIAKTCTKCGELKEAKCFRKNTRGYRVPDCNNCHNKRSRANMTAKNVLSHEHTERGRGNIWSDDEVQKLREFVAAGMPSSEISVKLGRSITAVHMKKSRMQILTSTPIVEAPEPEDEVEDEMSVLVPIRRRGIVQWVRAS